MSQLRISPLWDQLVRRACAASVWSATVIPRAEQDSWSPFWLIYWLFAALMEEFTEINRFVQQQQLLKYFHLIWLILFYSMKIVKLELEFLINKTLIAAINTNRSFYKQIESCLKWWWCCCCCCCCRLSRRAVVTWCVAGRSVPGARTILSLSPTRDTASWSKGTAKAQSQSSHPLTPLFTTLAQCSALFLQRVHVSGEHGLLILTHHEARNWRHDLRVSLSHTELTSNSWAHSRRPPH